MTYNFELSDVLPATPQAIYDAWMSSDGHSAMTGAPATIDPQLGGRSRRGTAISPAEHSCSSPEDGLFNLGEGPVTQSYPIEASWATRIRSGSPRFPICLIARDTVRSEERRVGKEG